MRILLYIGSLFLYLVHFAFTVETFFPSYKITVNGGEVLLNNDLLVPLKNKRTVSLSANDNLELGNDGYVLLENDLNHTFILAPGSQIELLSSPFNRHTYINLKTGEILVANTNIYSSDSGKIHIKIDEGLLSFPLGISYVKVLDNRNQVTVLEGSARYLDSKEFKVILNGPQSITIDIPMRGISHVLFAKQSKALLESGNKLFKFSSLTNFNLFISLLKNSSPNNFIPLDAFLPPPLEDHQIKILTTTYNTKTDNTSMIQQEKYFKIKPGFYTVNWKQKIEPVLVKHFPLVKLSINDDSYVKTKQHESVISLHSPNTNQQEKQIFDSSVSSNEKALMVPSAWTTLDMTGIKLVFNMDPDLIKIIDVGRKANIKDSYIKSIAENKYVCRLLAGNYKVEVKKKGFEVNDTSFSIKKNQFRHVNIDFFKPHHYRLVKEYGNSSFRLSNPMGITLNNEGNLYVVNSGNGKIKQYKDDKVLDIFKKKKNPLPYDITSWGRYTAVSYPEQNSILLFNKSKEQSRITSLLRPLGIDYNGQFIVVANSGDNTVKRFDNLEEKILGKDINFDQPSDVLIANQGIIISDKGNRRLVVLKEQGDPVRFFPLNYSPTFLAKNDDDDIYVSDTDNNYVHIYDKNFSALSRLDLGGASPTGIAIKENLIYVSLKNMNVVHVYRKIK